MSFAPSPAPAPKNDRPAQHRFGRGHGFGSLKAFEVVQDYSMDDDWILGLLVCIVTQMSMIHGCARI